MSAQHWLGDCGAVQEIPLRTMRPNLPHVNTMLMATLLMFGDLATTVSEDQLRDAVGLDPSGYTATATGAQARSLDQPDTRTTP